MADTILPFNVTAGISAAGDIAFSGAFAGTTGAFTKLVTLTGGISLSAGITFTDGTYQTSKTPDFLLFSMGII
jgi:hypothetical protein